MLKSHHARPVCNVHIRERSSLGWRPPSLKIGWEVVTKGVCLQQWSSPLQKPHASGVDGCSRPPISFAWSHEVTIIAKGGESARSMRAVAAVNAAILMVVGMARQFILY